MSETKTYPLRLPRSLKDAVERISKEEGTSINQFVAMAVAEKVSALETARFFQERKARADFKAFDRIMKRRGGQPPRAGDEIRRGPQRRNSALLAASTPRYCASSKIEKPLRSEFAKKMLPAGFNHRCSFF